MANIALVMQATGKERCQGCKNRFGRGEKMSAVEYDDGEPAGWFCGGCIKKWAEKGVEPIEGNN